MKVSGAASSLTGANHQFTQKLDRDGSIWQLRCGGGGLDPLWPFLLWDPGKRTIRSGREGRGRVSRGRPSPPWHPPHGSLPLTLKTLFFRVGGVPGNPPHFKVSPLLWVIRGCYIDAFCLYCL